MASRFFSNRARAARTSAAAASGACVSSAATAEGPPPTIAVNGRSEATIHGRTTLIGEASRTRSLSGPVSIGRPTSVDANGPNADIIHPSGSGIPVRLKVQTRMRLSVALYSRINDRGAPTGSVARVAAAALIVAAAPATPALPAPVSSPVARAARCDAAVRIDGLLDEPCWRDA